MDYIKGFIGSLLIYAALPDIMLTKPQTVLILIVGFMICVASIWKIQEIMDRHEKAERLRKFKRLINEKVG